MNLPTGGSGMENKTDGNKKKPRENPFRIQTVDPECQKEVEEYKTEGGTSIFVTFARLQVLDEGRVLAPSLALQFGRVEQLALLVQLLDLALLLLLHRNTHAMLSSVVLA